MMRHRWKVWWTLLLGAGLLLACNGVSARPEGGTTPPPPPNTGAPNAAAARGVDTTPPQLIPDANAPHPSTIFYGRQGCGPVTLTLGVTARDDSGQVAVAVKYWLSNAQGQTTTPKVVPMQPQGQGRYTVTLPLSSEAQAFLQGQPGTVSYQFIANDAAGNQTVAPQNSTAQGSVSLKPCTQGAAVPPATQKPPSSGSANQGQPQVRFTHVGHAPARVFYGRQCTASEPGAFVVEAQVDRPQDVQQVVMYFEYGQANAGQPPLQQALLLFEQGNGRYQVTFDVASVLDEAANYDTIYYQVVATLNDGRTISSAVKTVEIRKCARSAQGNPSSSGPILIDNVQAGLDPLYYGPACGPNDPQTVQVTATIDPLDAVASATLFYGWSPDPQQAPMTYQAVPMYLLGIGDYAADLDTRVFNNAYTGDGYLVVTIEVEGKDGQTYYTPHPVVVAQLKECVAQVPPPTIVFFRSEHANDTVAVGEQIYLSWETENATCGVYLDGQWVEESVSYYPAAFAQMPGSVILFTLEARGGDCSGTPEVATAQVWITVEDLATEPPPVVGCVGGDQLIVGPETPQVNADVDCDGMDDVGFVWYYHANHDREIVAVVGLNGTAVFGGLPELSATECRDLIANAMQTGLDVSESEIATGVAVCYITGTDQAGMLVVDAVDMLGSSTYSVRYSFTTEFANP